MMLSSSGMKEGFGTCFRKSCKVSPWLAKTIPFAPNENRPNKLPAKNERKELIVSFKSISISSSLNIMLLFARVMSEYFIEESYSLDKP